MISQNSPKNSPPFVNFILLYFESIMKADNTKAHILPALQGKKFGVRDEFGIADSSPSADPKLFSRPFCNCHDGFLQRCDVSNWGSR